MSGIRSLLVVALVAAWSAAAPAQPALSINMSTDQRWVEHFRSVESLRAQGLIHEAAAQLPGIVAEAREHARTGSAHAVQLTGIRMRTLLAYGDVLIRLDRAREAIPLLEEAAAIERQDLDERARNPDPRALALTYTEALISRDAHRQLFIANTRHFAQGVDISGATLNNQRWAEQLPQLDSPFLLLAEAHSRLGERERVLQVYRGPFRQYLRRQLEKPPKYRQAVAPAAQLSCLRIFLSLARLGPSTEAEEAFACANDPEFRAERPFWRNPATVDAAAARRRLVMGAYASYAFASGDLDAAQRRTLLEMVADSKAVGARYRGRLRSLWLRSSHPAFFTLRPEFDALDRELQELPTAWPKGVPAWRDWVLREAILYERALPALEAEGLMDVFNPGARIIEQVQQGLREHGGREVVIGYAAYKPVDPAKHSLLPERVLRYVLTESSGDIRDIGTLREIQSLVAQWRGSMARGQEAAGAALSQRLLSGLPETARLAAGWVIDPDGAIGLVPFEALEGADGVRVIERHAVRYVTSLASMADSRARRSELREGGGATRTALVVGDPDFSDLPSASLGETWRSAGQVRGFDATGITPLPETRTEILGVKGSLERMGVVVHARLGRQATPAAFSFRDPPRFLHVATHGVFLSPDEEQSPSWAVRVRTTIPGMQSALVLARDDTGALLTGADLARLPLQGTELVALSACDTGNGAVNVGEGVVSLRRGIEEAGALSSLTSLWAVPSASTTQLMTDFYTRIAGGVSKSEALRQAKLHLMRSKPAPLHWAGFLLAGAD